jgi:outer membrane usher protein
MLLILTSAQAEPPPPPLSESVLEVALNESASSEMMVVLRGPQGQLYLEESDFIRLRLRLPQTTPYMHEGKRYYQPTAIRGLNVSIDEASQRAVITPPAVDLETTRISAAARDHTPISPAEPGAFLNYQFSGQQIDHQNIGGAFAELGLFAGTGVLTNTAVARYGDGTQVVRLDTTYTRDFPERLDTLNLGDAISDGASWGNAVRFAGIRYSRNFGLRPDLLTTPLLATSGTANVPSTVDVFVNHQLVSSSQLPAGPFIVDRLPAVSGTGDVSVVVRDALGREQVLTQTFYSSTTLLAQGFSQYSFNLGKIRDDYGLASAHYGSTLGEFSYRRGITDAITLEGHGEYLGSNAHAAGLNAAFAVGTLGVINVTGASGGDARGSGVLSGVGVEHRGSNTSFIANTQWASSGFAQVGEPLDTGMRMRQRTLLQSGSSLGRFGSLSLAYVRQTYQQSPTQQTVSLTHNITFGSYGTVNLTVSRIHTDAVYASPAQNSTSAYLIYALPLGGGRAATLSAVSGSGPSSPQSEVIAAFTQSPPVGPGSGYRISASSIGNYDADWRQQFRAVDVEVEAAKNAGSSGRSLYASGAMTYLDGELNASRSVNGSFAMVDVAGIPDVPVYVENQLTTHTDAEGKALLYNLRSYQANRISIQPEDLPLDTTIAASSTVMAPPYRSGVVARFPVERVRSGTFRLVTPDGKDVPVGARVTLKGAEFPVVLNGMVYVTGYDHGMAAEANWEGGHCSFRLEPPPPDEPLPDMGTVVCRPNNPLRASNP